MLLLMQPNITLKNTYIELQLFDTCHMDSRKPDWIKNYLSFDLRNINEIVNLCLKYCDNKYF